jgi:cold shock CspA family protein/ribosome-associated translation inhibitor RaiA
MSSLRLHYRDMPASPAVDAFVAERFAHLQSHCVAVPIRSGVVTLELASRRAGRIGRAGGYRVVFEVAVPGTHLVVERQTGEHDDHAHAYAAIDAAFTAMERRLREHAQRLRQDVKHHEAAAGEACVRRLFPDDGYGFLETPDGREVYFHEHAVLDDGFRRLTLGTPVRFCEEAGEKGPQATTVRIVAGRAAYGT